MENFCGKCGSKLDPQTGLCPKCSTGQIPEGAKQVRQSGNSNRPMHFLKWMLIAIAFLAIAAGIMYGLAYFGVVNLTGLPGLPCQHEWVEATCTTSRTCSLCGETDGEPLGHTPGKLEEKTDYTTCVQTTSRHCTRCHELLESGTEELSTLVDESGFICSPHDILERLKTFSIKVNSTANYTVQNDTDVILASLTCGPDCDAMIQFFDWSQSPTKIEKLYSSGFNWISVTYCSTTSEINSAYVADFCNACDPQLGSAAEKTAKEIIQAGQEALSKGEGAALYQKNGVSYEIISFSNDTGAGPYSSFLMVTARSCDANNCTQASGSPDEDSRDISRELTAKADRYLTTVTKYTSDRQIWYRLLFDWDKNGNLIRVREVSDPVDTKTWKFQYNEKGQLLRKDFSSRDYNYVCQENTYRPDGKLQGRIEASDTEGGIEKTSFYFDSTGRQYKYISTDGTFLCEAIITDFSDQGNPTWAENISIDFSTGVQTHSTESLCYDELGRITFWNYSNGSEKETITYRYDIHPFTIEKNHNGFYMLDLLDPWYTLGVACWNINVGCVYTQPQQYVFTRDTGELEVNPDGYLTRISFSDGSSYEFAYS